MKLEDLHHLRDDLVQPVWLASSPGRPLTSEQTAQIHRVVTALMAGTTWALPDRMFLEEMLDLASGEPSKPALSRDHLPRLLNLLKQKIARLEQQAPVQVPVALPVVSNAATDLDDLRYLRDDLILPVWLASSPGRPLTRDQMGQIHRAVMALLGATTWSLRERILLEEVRDLSRGDPSKPVLSRDLLPSVLNLVKPKIQRLEQQAAAPESAWSALGAAMASTEHAADLKPLLELGILLRPVDRERLAQIVGALIEKAEWPASWVKPRADLVRALEDLVPLLDTTRPESAMSQLGVNPRTPLAMGSVVLRVVVHLLAAPCPPGELRYLAALCNLVLVLVSETNQRELAYHGPAVPSSIDVARERLGAALSRYQEAARTINDVCGEALFDPLQSEP